MNLGEKIKAARLERHMTQKDVVGDYITRNMLSKIENGSATPSVKTLEYLAGVLGLPAGYFMNDSNGDELTPGSVASARNHFRDGEYEGCVQVLEGLDMEGGYKDEAMLLLARAKISLSKKAMIDGRYEEATRLAREASGAMRTPCITPQPSAPRRCCWWPGAPWSFRGISRRRWTIIRPPIRIRAWANFTGSPWRNTTLIRAIWRMPGRKWTALPVCPRPPALPISCCRAAWSSKDNQFDQAAKQLEKAEQLARTTGSNYFMSSLYAMLEQCYREMDDFKKAYHYASMQLQIKE